MNSSTSIPPSAIRNFNLNLLVPGCYGIRYSRFFFTLYSQTHRCSLQSDSHLPGGCTASTEPGLSYSLLGQMHTRTTANMIISGTVNEGRKQHPWIHYRHLNKPFRPTVVGNITHMHCQRTDVIQCLPFFHSANSKICFRRLKSTSVEYFSLRVTISVAKVLSGLEPSTPNISTTNFPFPGD